MFFAPLELRDHREGAIMKRYFSKLAAVLISAAFILPVLPTNAEAGRTVCGDRAKLIEGLKTRYKEEPVALGISQKNTQALEIFASEAGTWTAIMTMPTGVACIMAAGHSWHDVPRQLAGSVT